MLGLALALLLAATAVAAPSCAEGPQIEGNAYVGTPCDDTIRMPRATTFAYGEGGDDTIYGQRGNDRIYGGDGNDNLYGGIGDDQLRGGPGDDLLSGGFGADSALDGEAGNDLVRGDATIDRIENTDGGFDTLSYATGVTPGFFDRPGVSEYAGLPPGRDGRGAYVDLGGGLGDNGLAPDGGGVDLEVDGTGFEVVVGTAFSDYIVGTGGPQTIYGGGGADVILGEGGGDTIYGGAEGDYCATTEASVSECEFSGGDKQVAPRDPGTVDAGRMAPQAGVDPALYLTGSSGDDTVTATYAAATDVVSFAVGGSPFASFDLDRPPDSLLVAGLGGNDTIVASGFPESTSVVLLGGAGIDQLTSGETEDALVDGAGNDEVQAGGRDDAVPNNEGADSLHAGAGEDLFVDDAVCEGDLLDGGADRDNANWANFDEGVTIDMAAGKAGRVGPAGQAECPSPGLLTTLLALEDVEGTSFDDVLAGDSGDNQLLGRPGQDSYFAAAGNDSILANSGDSDLAIDCGEGWDTALIDIPTAGYGDPAPVECEDVEERPVNSFRPPGTPPNPNPPPEEAPAEGAPPSSPPPAPVGTSPSGGETAQAGVGDDSPPQTRLYHRPAHVATSNRRLRRISFGFNADEPGSTFRCRLDRQPFRICVSPRRYRVRAGRHAFRVYAVDPAGNRDPTPVVYRFRILPVIYHSSRSHHRRGSNR